MFIAGTMENKIGIWLTVIIFCQLPSGSLLQRCDFPLGMENYDIEDYQLSSSETMKSSTYFAPAWNARLNSGALLPMNYMNGNEQGWFTFASLNNHWLQLDLLVSHKITSIAIQGNPTSAQYIKTFKVKYSSNDLENWQWYTDNAGNHKVLPENSSFSWNYLNPITERINLHPPIKARGIRIIAISQYDTAVLRMEVYGCTLETQNYTEYSIPTPNITTTSDKIGSLLNIKLEQTYAISSLTVQGSVLNGSLLNNSNSVTAYYKKTTPDATWRNVNISDFKQVGDSVNLLLALALKGTEINLYCDTTVLQCKNLTAVYGKKLGSCPLGFVEYEGYCYNHLPVQQQMSNDNERGICKRMAWGDNNISMAVITSISELHLVKDLGKRSGSYTFLGMFRANSTAPWFDQSGNKLDGPYFFDHTSTYMCAGVYSLARPVSCDYARFVSCKVKAQGVPKHSGCEWTIVKQDYRLSTTDKLIILGRELSECMWECQNQNDFMCVSIEWRYSDNECRLNKYYSDSPGVSFISDSHTDVVDYQCVQDAGCMEPLISKNNTKQNVTLTASSTHSSSSIDNVRLDNLDAPSNGYYWYPSSYSNSWFQVEFSRITRVQKLIMLGGIYESNSYVRTFYLLYTNITDYWSTYQDRTGLTKEFEGPQDRYGVAKHILLPSIVAKYARIEITRYYSLPAMRLELYGCPIDGEVKPVYWPYNALGMDSYVQHDIQNYQLSAQYTRGYPSNNPYYPPWQARLRNNPDVVIGREKAFWAGISGTGQWFQVDFLTVHKIVGITMNGGGSSDSAYFTKELKFKYSTTSADLLTTILDESGNDQIFPGQVKYNYATYVALENSTVNARYFRILHTSFVSNSYQRYEFYGEPVMEECPILGSNKIHNMSREPYNSCSFCNIPQLPSLPRMCLGDASVSLTVQLKSMQFLQGLDIHWDATVNSSAILQSVKILYFHPGNSSWSPMWFRIKQIDSEPTITRYQGQRMSHATKVRLEMPSIPGQNVNCATIKIYGCPAQDCPPGFAKYQRKCYQIPEARIQLWNSTSNDFSWDQLNMCKKMTWGRKKVDLGSVSNDEEMDFIYKMNKRSGTYLYIGLWAPNASVTPYKWEWKNGNPSTWQHWYPGEPNAVGTYRCAMIHSSYSRMFDIDCSGFYNYLCVVDALTVENTTTVTEWAIHYEAKMNVMDQQLTLKYRSISECLSLCESGLLPNCTAVNYYYSGKTCYLITSNIIDNNITSISNYDFYYIGEFNDECIAPLVWQNFPVQVEVSASSVKNGHYDVVHADLNNMASVWMSLGYSTVVQEFIHVDFHSVAKIVKLTMMGGGSVYNCYVTAYRLLYTNDTRWWSVYSNNKGEQKLFTGPRTRYDTHKQYLKPAMIGRFVRIQIQTAYRAFCMKFEFYGCIIARDSRNYCSVVSRSSSSSDYYRYSYIEINGHPSINKHHGLPNANYKGMFLLTMDSKLCQSDLVSDHDLYTNVTGGNIMLRRRLTSFENGTWVYGITNEDGEYVDILTEDFLTSMALHKLAINLKTNQNKANSFTTIIGDSSSSKVESTYPGYGPAMLIKNMVYGKTQADLLNTALPNPIAHWPFSQDFQDISTNKHFQVNGNEIFIDQDPGTWNHRYSHFDGTSNLIADVNGNLQLFGDFTIFLAINPQEDGPLFTFHDSISGYTSSFKIAVYNNKNGIRVYGNGSDVIVELSDAINDNVWNFIALTFESNSKVLRWWKNGRVTFDTLSKVDYSAATNKRYISVGTDGTLFKGKISCMQFYDQPLAADQIQRLIFECRSKPDMLEGITEEFDQHRYGPLGVMTETIATSQVKVSSTLSPAIYHSDGLPLYSNSKGYYDYGCWMPVSYYSKHEWIQVDFDMVYKVSGVVFGNCRRYYTSKALIEYAIDERNWTVLVRDGETNNKTTMLSYNNELAIFGLFPRIIQAMHLRMWVHTTYRIGAKFEVIGRPLDLPEIERVVVENIDINILSSCPTVHVTHNLVDFSILKCSPCGSTTATNAWFEIDLKLMLMLTSIKITYQNDSATYPYGIIFQKRFYVGEWEDLSEIPILDKQSSGNLINHVYNFLPILRTQYLKLKLHQGNVGCFAVSLYGKSVQSCPKGSIHVNKRCLDFHYSNYVRETHTYQNSEVSCKGFHWATTGRTAVPRDVNQAQFLMYLIYTQGVSSTQVGMTHTGNAQTAFWSDGTSAHPIPWKYNYPKATTTSSFLESTAYYGTPASSTSYAAYICETNSSDFIGGNQTYLLTITAVDSFKLFVDGAFQGSREWWNYPWIISVDKTVKVIAVEVNTATSGSPGLIAKLSDGTVTDNSWKCTTTWEIYWPQVDFNDAHWKYAFEIEQYSTSEKILHYGFDNSTINPFWIQPQNFNSTGGLTFYCRKTLDDSFQTVNKECKTRWIYWPKYCQPNYYETIEHALTITECIAKCQQNTNFSCSSVDYYQDNRYMSCYLRRSNRSELQRDLFQSHSQCHHYEEWCSDCSESLLHELYAQGLANITVSTGSADGSTINNYTFSSRSFNQWASSTTNVYQWIEAIFTDYVNITAISTQGREYALRSYQVYYLDPSTSGYLTIKDSTGNNKIFYGHQFATMMYATNILETPLVTMTVRINPLTWYSRIRFNIDIVGCVLKDYQPDMSQVDSIYWTLGMESGDIGISQITSKEPYSSIYAAHQGRLNRKPAITSLNSGCWRPKRSPYELTVDLLIEHEIKGVRFQGCPNTPQSITGLSLRYSSDGETWNQTYDSDGSTEMIYEGTTFEGDFISNAYIDSIVQGRYVKAVVKTYLSYPGLRIEIIGKPNDCAAVNTSNVVSLSGSDGIDGYSASNIIQESVSNNSSTWCPDLAKVTFNDTPEVVIELESLYLVTSVGIKNNTGITKFAVQYSNDGQKWKTYHDEKLNTDVLDIQGKDQFYFQRILRLKSIKIIIKEWNGQPCLQVSIHACKAEACPQHSVLQNDTCYFKDRFIFGTYEDSKTYCKDYNWAGNGYPVMPKNWERFNFLQALAYPEKRYRTTYYIGLTNNNDQFAWADNLNVTNSSMLPWANLDSHECSVIGATTGKFSSYVCTTNLQTWCETPSSLASTENKTMWLNRWYVDIGTIEKQYSYIYSVDECMQFCLKTTNFNCTSLTYSTYYKRCRLFSITINMPAANPTTNSHYHYFEFYTIGNSEVNLLMHINASASVTASSYYEDHQPFHSVYDPQFTISTPYWRCSENDLSYPWVKIDFGEHVYIRRIFITASPDINNYYTRKVSLMSSHNGIGFKYYYNDPATNTNAPMLVHDAYLTNVQDSNTALLHPLITRYLKVSVNTYTGRPVLRLAVYGSRVEGFKPDIINNDCYSSLGMQSGTIKPSQLSSSSTKVLSSGQWYSPFNAALGTFDQENDLAGWIPYSYTNSFLQVQLTRIFHISYIVTQGIGGDYVKTYNLHYSIDMIAWIISSRDDGTAMTYEGYVNQIIQPINPSIKASALRIYPKSYYGKVALRFELVGCTADCPVVPINETSAKGWKSIQPCSTNSSLQCSVWCSDANDLINIKLDLGSDYLLTGFSMMSLNDTKNLPLNISLNVLEYENSLLEIMTKNATKSEEYANTTGSFVKWNLIESVTTSSIYISASTNSQTQCIKLELHACKINACPMGFTQYIDQCYYFRDEPLKSYYTFKGNSYNYSNNVCEGLTSDSKTGIALPTDTETNYFLQSLAVSSSASMFLSTKYDNESDTWTSYATNLTLQYTHWDVAGGHPNEANGLCVHMYRGFWQSVSCDYGKIMCQTKAKKKSRNRWAYFRNIKLMNVVAFQIVSNVKFIAACLQMCEKFMECNSVEYKPLTFECALYKETRYIAPLILQSGNYFFYEKVSTDTCDWMLLDIFQYTITASSDFSALYSKDFVVMDKTLPSETGGFWKPATNDVNQWIQVTFIEEVIMNQLVVIGADYLTASSQISRFKLQVSKDLSRWKYVLNEIDNSELYSTYTGYNGLSQYMFSSLPTGRGFKLLPVAWKNYIALQLKIYGCLNTEQLTNCATKQNPVVEIDGEASSKSLKCFGNWDIVMEHFHGENNFNTEWNNYKNGFNSTSGNDYFLGNLWLSYLTRRIGVMLRIDMWNENKDYIYAEFDQLAVHDEENGYELVLNDFITGTAGTGGLLKHSGFKFYSQDMAIHSSCASNVTTGFWYLLDNTTLATDQSDCFQSLLTGHQKILWKNDTSDSHINVLRVVMRMKAKIESVNVAFGKPAFQSSTSTFDGYVASRAVDGYSFVTPSLGSCSGTKNQTDPFWMVDLEKQFPLFSILITSSDSGDTLKDFNVLVSKFESNPSAPNLGLYSLCRHYNGTVSPPGSVISLNCTENTTARYVAIQMTGTFNVLQLCEVQVFTKSIPVGLDELCSWDGDCNVQFSQCLAVNATSMMLNFTCQCAKYYLPESGICKPVVDVFLSIEYTTSTVVRETKGNFSLHVNVYNNDSRDIWGVESPNSNFEFNMTLTDKNSTSENGVFTKAAFPYSYVNSSADLPLNSSSSLSLTLVFEMFVTLEECFLTKYVCLEVKTPVSASYFERNIFNNIVCLPVTNSIMCQPYIDVLVNSVEYLNNSVGIVRNTPAYYQFAVTISSVPGSYNAAKSYGQNINYVFSYLLTSHIIDDGVLQVNAPELVTTSVSFPDFQKPLIAQQNLTLLTKGLINMGNFSVCSVTKYCCIFLKDHPSASYRELNFTNNVQCVDIQKEFTCNPEIPVAVIDIDFNDVNEFLRGYKSSANLKILVKNTHSWLPVEEISDPLFNYNITLYVAANNFSLPTRFKNGLYQTIVPDIGISELQQGISVGGNITLHAMTKSILVQRADCDFLKYICAEILPTTYASYQLYPGNHHIKCIPSLDVLNCKGIPVANISFTHSPSVSAVSSQVAFSISWKKGTDVNYTVDFGDNSPLYSWNWKDAGHLDDFDDLLTTTSHIYNRIGNFTATLQIWNEVGEESHKILVIIEPYLDQSIIFNTTYTPSAVPLTVLINLNHDAYDQLGTQIWMTCNLDYVDENETVSIVLNKSHSVSHTFNKDLSSQLPIEVVCQNHVSNVKYNSYVILRQQIKGLVLNTMTPALPTKGIGKFLVTMATGSHVSLDINFGDGTNETFSNANIYSYNFTWIVEHMYMQQGNYSVTVYGFNEYFNYTLYTGKPVMVQHPVPPFNLSSVESNIKVPDGTAIFTLTSLGDLSLLPAGVLCNWIYYTDASEVVSGEGVMTGANETRQFTYKRMHIGIPITVKVSCYNLVNTFIAYTVIQLYEEMRGLIMNVSPIYYKPMQNITFELNFGTGSNAVFSINYGDGIVDLVEYPNVFAGSSVSVVHQYNTEGNYSIIISVSNPISTTDKQITMVIQNPLINLTLSGNDSVLWTPGTVDFVINAISPQRVLKNVLCHWKYNDMLFEYTYHDLIDEVYPVKHSYSFPRSAIGQVYVKVNCSNLVSSFQITHSTEIVLDAVIVGKLETDDWLWWTNSSKLNLTITRFGSNSCFEWDMDDGQKFLYGVPWCQASALTKGLQLFPIVDGISFLHFNYTYKTWGNYNVKVFAYNHVSEDHVSILAVVKDWYCYKPNITYPKNITNVNNPMAFLRSQQFLIKPLYIAIDCMKSLNESTSILNIFDRTNLNDQVVSYNNATFIEDTVRLFPYGEYTAVLKITMLDMPRYFKEAEFYFDIIKSPLNINIKGPYNSSINFKELVLIDAQTVSFDPDVDPIMPQGLSFEWSCRQSSELYLKDHAGNILEASLDGEIGTSATTFKGCFGLGPGKLPHKTGSFYIDTEEMFPNKQYMFDLKVTKDDRVAVTRKVINIIPPAPPTVNIVCRDNCNQLVRLATSLTIKANCIKKCFTRLGGIQHQWKLEWKNKTTGKIFSYNTSITDIGFQSNILYVNPWMLVGGVNHTASVTVWTPGSLRATVKYPFTSNKSPFGGECDVTPTEGYASETLFSLACIGWQEWDGPGKTKTLKFEYRVSSVPSPRDTSNPRSFLVYYGKSMTSDPSYLPMGNFEMEFQNSIELYIVDSIGDFFRVGKIVKVWPLPEPKLEAANKMMNTISDNNSTLSRDVANGNYQGLSATIFSHTSLLNLPASFDTGANVTEDISAITEQRRMVRDEFIKVIAKVPVESPDGLSQTNAVIRSLLLEATELTINSQENAVDKLDSMTDYFVQSRGNVTGDAKKMIATDLGSSSVRVMIAGDITMNVAAAAAAAGNSSNNKTDGSATNTSSSDIYSKVGEVMKSSVNVIAKITETILADKEVGDVSDIIDLNEVVLVVAKETGYQLSNSSYTTSHGQVHLPDINELLPESDGLCVSVNLMMSSINPYIWDSSATNVTSAIASFDMTDCSSSNNNKTARRKRSTKDINFDVELAAVNHVPANIVNTTLESSDVMVFHSLNITSSNNPVTISVYPNGNESLKIFVQYEVPPTLTDFVDSFIVPTDENVTDKADYETKHTLYIHSEKITQNNVSQIYIAVKKNGCKSEGLCESFSATDIVYSYRLTQPQCTIWDSVLEIWTSEGCQVLPGSTPKKIKFKSNLFGSMGAGVFVGPNTIDFSKVFDNLSQKLVDNAAVVGTVVGVILLFIPLVLVCRRFDKKDKRKWSILPLVDNNPADSFYYEVHVYTGLRTDAETDSGISIVLAGTETDTGIRRLNDGDRKNFQRGDVSSFLMQTQFNLGVPVSLKVWHDNSGEGNKAGWFLSKVVIIDLQEKKWYMFTCEDWLSAEEGDSQIERLLQLASSDELVENSGTLLQNNIAKKLFDEHIWLSVGYRTTRSLFSRVQRLSSCLAILFLTMLSNAMWYGTGDDHTTQVAFTIGPISLTVQELYTSLMGSIVIVPPVLIITLLFSNANEKPQNSIKNGEKKLEAKGALERDNNKKKKIPYWGSYIAYILVVLSVSAGAFLTILYAFQWGKEKSEAWLITFFLSFFQSVVLIQPLKVILAAALLTFLFKKDSNMTDYEDVLGKMEDRNDSLEPANKDILSTKMHLSQEEIDFAKKKKVLNQKLITMIKEITWHVILMALVLFVVLGNQNRNVYWQNTDLRNTFLSDIESVSMIDNLWDWLDEILLPGLYYQKPQFSKSDADERFLDKSYAIKLGAPRLRQLRVKPEKCNIPSIFGASIICTREFSDVNQDTTNYTHNWQSYNESFVNFDYAEPFEYISAEDMDGIFFWGNLMIYPSGGYVANLGNTLQSAKLTLYTLKKSDWIDNLTRVVFVEFNVWNPNTNLFNMFMLSFEMSNFGGIVTWVNIDSVQLYRYAGPGGLVNLLAEIILTIFIIVLTIIQIYNGVKSRGQHTKQFWNVITMLCLIMFYTALGVYIWRSILTSQKVEEMMNNKGATLNFQMLVLAHTIFMCLMALMAFMMILRTSYILRYNETIAVFGHVLIKSYHRLLGMFICFGIIFMAFSMLCFGLFHIHSIEYRTLQKSMTSLSEAFLGKFDFHNIVTAQGVFGGIILLIYLLIMMCITMNLFVAVLNDVLENLKKDPSSLPANLEVVEYFISMLQKLLTIKQKKSDSGEVYQNLTSHLEEPEKETPAERLMEKIDTLNVVLELSDRPISNTTAMEDLLVDFVNWNIEKQNNLSQDS